ncbi:MAG TPA: class I SAM-dependent methyltransferase [Vicinamibacteria bacterium]|nr:class I SAM-dependent methyltransferase [Vicinamibacteria bacterium]
MNQGGTPLTTTRTEFAQITSLTYDKVAQGYDELWSRNVAVPNARLTSDLDLRQGDRVADLACGTGVYTLEMARLARPGEVVAVDYSEGMLAAARERLEEAGYAVSLVHARAEDFVAHTPPGSFDVVSLRFALAYIDWREVLPMTGRMLRPGGRVGVLTSVTSSVPQLYALFDRFRTSFEPVWKLYQHCGKNIGDTWRLIRRLRDTFAHGRFIAVPSSAEQVAERLAAGGLVNAHVWTEKVRLWFDSGHAAVAWARGSGYATHPSLDAMAPHEIRFLENLFAAGLEGFREKEGIPLDLVVGGVVARKA